jgi:putative SOS response-associated peptidase YedK
MCGRFTATFEFSDIRVRWNLDRDLPKYTPRFNIAPETSPNIPVIIRQKGVNEWRLMQWGLIPHWAADPSIGNPPGATAVILAEYEKIVGDSNAMAMVESMAVQCQPPAKFS